MTADRPRDAEAPDRSEGLPAGRLTPIQDLLAQLRAVAGGPSMSVASLMQAMDPRAQPVFLLMPALILVSPLSGIPGLSSLGGLTIALVALQILVHRPTIWLPGFVLRRQMSTERLLWALERLERPARFLDRRSSARAGWVLIFPGRELVLLTCAACGLAMPFLELVPFSATTLAFVVTILATGLLIRDGLLAGLGLCAGGLAILLIVWLVPS